MYFTGMKKFFPTLLLGLLATATWPTTAEAASPPAPSKYPVPTVTFTAPAEFRGDSTTLRVLAVIPKGWHIQSNIPLDDFLIPTEVKVKLKEESEGLRFGKPVFPKAVEKDFPALGGKVALFEDTVEVSVPVYRKGAQKDKLKAGKAAAATVVTLRYQACNDSQCLPPKEIAARFVNSL
jgi:hypothetical protein